MKQKYIKEIEERIDNLIDLRDKNSDYFTINELDSVCSDIESYFDDDFKGWTIKELKEYIIYLDELLRSENNNEKN